MTTNRRMKHERFRPERPQGESRPRKEAGHAKRGHREVEEARGDDSPQRLTQSAAPGADVEDADGDGGGATAPGEAVSRQAKASREAMAERWADPDYRARISAQMKARWADPAYRERARGNNRDPRTYRWQHNASGRIVSRTKLEMREEFGLKPDALDCLVSGCTRTSRGWRLAPRSLLGEAPRWIFP